MAKKDTLKVSSGLWCCWILQQHRKLDIVGFYGPLRYYSLQHVLCFLSFDDLVFFKFLEEKFILNFTLHSTCISFVITSLCIYGVYHLLC